jgi:hypothetical protein
VSGYCLETNNGIKDEKKEREELILNKDIKNYPIRNVVGVLEA